MLVVAEALEVSRERHTSAAARLPRASSASPNRAMLRAVGFKDGDFGKPIVRDRSCAHATITPCNAGLRSFAAPRRTGAAAGGRDAPDLRNDHRQRRHFDGHGGHALFARLARGDRRFDRDGVRRGRNRMGRAASRSAVRQENMPGRDIAIARLDIPAISSMAARSSLVTTPGRISGGERHVSKRRQQGAGRMPQDELLVRSSVAPCPVRRLVAAA